MLEPFSPTSFVQSRGNRVWRRDGTLPRTYWLLSGKSGTMTKSLTPNLVLFPPLDQFTTWSRKFDYPSNLLPTCAATKIDTIWRHSHAKYCGRLPSPPLLPSWWGNWRLHNTLARKVKIISLLFLLKSKFHCPTKFKGHRIHYSERRDQRSSDKHGQAVLDSINLKYETVVNIYI